MLFANVADAGAAGLEDPQPEQTEQGDEREAVRIPRQPGGADQGLEPQIAEPESR
jgi:hypothetical protein